MAPPEKRQRLESPSQCSDDTELVLFEDDAETIHPEIRDRIACRNRFKSALEGIFEKYGQDFTGIGDEIDLISGRVVVDNGHLVNIAEEGDVGECLGDSEGEEVDSEDDSEGSLPDSPKHGLQIQPDDLPVEDQEWDEQPLASLHLDMTISKQITTPGRQKLILSSQAKDPKWQIPDIPGVNFEERSNYDNEMQTAAHNSRLPRSKKPKSPGKSLWKYARHSKIYQQPSHHSSRARNIWHDVPNIQDGDISTTTTAVQDRDFQSDHNLDSHAQGLQSSAHPMTAMGQRAMQREAAILTAKTGEWSVQEEQDLIRHRLNTSLNYVALASKFPGRTAAMVKQRWKYLKKKMIELPATTAARMGAALLEAKRNERHDRSLATTRQDHSAKSNNTQYDIQAHPQDPTNRSLGSGSVAQLYGKVLQNAEGNKTHPDLVSANRTITCTANDKRQCLDHDPSHKILSGPAKREQELRQHLQELDNNVNAGGNRFSHNKQQRMPDNMWNMFPPFDQMGDIINEGSRGILDQSRSVSSMSYYSTWQNPAGAPLISPFCVPYGPISRKNSLLSSENRAATLQGIPDPQINDTMSIHQTFQQPNDFTTAETDLFSIGVDRHGSHASSSTVDLMTLASGTRVQADYTPDSSRSLMQLPDSVHGAKTDEMIIHQKSDMQQQAAQQTAIHFHNLVEEPEARMPLQITSIPDTQDASSPIAMKSSNHPVGDLYNASELALSNIAGITDLPFKKPKDPLPKSSLDSTRLMASISRQSSPLSLLSSSDPRMARPSDLSSSISAKEAEVSKLNGTFQRSIEPIPETRPSTPDTDATELIDLQSSNEAVDMDQTLAGHQNSFQQAIIPAKSANVPIVIDRPMETTTTPRYILPKPAVQSCTYEQNLVVKKTVSPLDIMKEVEDNFQSVHDSFAESILLLEPIARRKQINENNITRSGPIAHHSRAIGQFHHPVVHRSKVSKSGFHNVSGPTTWQSRERAERPFSSNLQSASNTAGRLGNPTSLHQKNGKATRYENGKNTHNYTAFRNNNFGPSGGDRSLRHVREVTPIDTYSYMLADPWPTDPLPADKIPGIWKESQSKDRKHTEQKTTEQALEDSQDLQQDIYHSSASVSSRASKKSQNHAEAKVINNTKPEEILTQVPLPQLITMSKPNPPPVVGNDQIADQETRVATATETALPESTTMNPTMVNPTAIAPTKNSPQLPILQSPDPSVSDRMLNTHRKQSPADKAEDILLEFGRGRPLTRANLLSQDEIPSTSQETVLSFLNSQTTQTFRPPPTPKSSLLAQPSRPRSKSATKACGANGFRCEKRVCTNCASRVVSQEDIDF